MNNSIELLGRRRNVMDFLSVLKGISVRDSVTLISLHPALSYYLESHWISKYRVSSSVHNYN